MTKMDDYIDSLLAKIPDEKVVPRTTIPLEHLLQPTALIAPTGHDEERRPTIPAEQAATALQYPVCNKSFLRAVELRRHERRKTPCKPPTHWCPSCGKGYASRKSLWNHQRRSRTRPATRRVGNSDPSMLRGTATRSARSGLLASSGSSDAANQQR